MRSAARSAGVLVGALVITLSCVSCSSITPNTPAAVALEYAERLDHANTGPLSAVSCARDRNATVTTLVVPDRTTETVARVRRVGRTWRVTVDRHASHHQPIEPVVLRVTRERGRYVVC